MNRLRLRVVSILGLLLFMGYLTAANFVPEAQRLASPLLPDEGLRLGLDLRGGTHWVLGVELETAEVHELQFLGDSLQRFADEEDVSIERVSVADLKLTLSPVDAEGARLVRDYLEDFSDLNVSEGHDIVVTLGRDRSAGVRGSAMRQVLEVLRRRINDPATGVPESVVTRQGDNRILIQIPGGESERERMAKILDVTGLLEFKIVQDAAQTVDLLNAKYPEGLPAGTMIETETDRESERVIQAYLVSEKAGITGDFLTDARVQFDRQGRSVVGFTFNAEGGRVFSKLTSENIGAGLAIILDGNVYSAPIIRSQISMRGQIEGRFSAEESANLAVVLRAGSLSVPVEIEEERTVGPALGKDSIDRGVRASVVGLVLILLFIIGYYRMSGLYAAVALLANLVLLIGIMSLFEATLTLPGLAGIVLTVGMAVDANVIIIERVREELRSGKTPRAAISTAFSKAYWTIMDANITTLITAIILFEYGSGPIKGFAVTLSVGVITSVFAALVITRTLYGIFPGTRPVESLSV